jgi:hypothetical protein
MTFWTGTGVAILPLSVCVGTYLMNPCPARMRPLLSRVKSRARGLDGDVLQWHTITWFSQSYTARLAHHTHIRRHVSPSSDWWCVPVVCVAWAL